MAEAKENKVTAGKTIGNILWMLLGGLEWAIGMFIMGAICCVTIILIPVGIQLFQLGKFVIWPFNKEVIEAKPNGFKAFVNVLWAILFGWELFLLYGLFGAICCITIIGIPFGKQYFKIAKFVIWPLGRTFS